MADSSVWIDFLNRRDKPETRKLYAAFAREEVILGDFILMEILRGARNDALAAGLERDMHPFVIEPMLDANLAVKAAANYRALRSIGITVRKSIDIVIGTFCIERGHTLLHNDRDFDPMQQHLGLKVL